MEEDIQLRKNLANLIELLENDGSSIVLRSSGIWTNTGWHRESGSIDACELLFIFEGSTTLRIGNRAFNPKKGETYIYDLSEKSYCESGKFKLYFLTIASKDNHIQQRLREYIRFISPFLPFRSDNTIETNCQKILHEAAAEKPYTSILVAHFLSEIFINLFRLYVPAASSRSAFPYEPIKGKIADEVMVILNEKYGEKLTLEFIGDVLSLNPRYINSVFKEINGVTIRQHLIRIRLGAAKKLLKYTSMHVTDIAMETGFSDCQHFCRSFSKHEGSTPLEFRKRSKA